MIGEFLKKNPKLAYGAEEVALEMRLQLPLVSGRGRSSAHVVEIQAALEELVEAGVVAVYSDGTKKRYSFQERISTSTKPA